MRLYLEHYGLTHTEARTILQCYNGVQPVPGLAARSELLITLHDNTEAFTAMEDMVDADQVLGDPGENHATIAELRSGAQALIEKVAALSEDQAEAIQGFALGFWAGWREGRGTAA